MKQENIKNTQSFNQTAKPLDEAAQKRRRKDAYQSTITSRVIFLITGIMLLVLSISLAGTAILAFVKDRGTRFHLIVMLAIAVYAFTKITLAAMNWIKARKSKSAKLITLRNISFADAFVSVFSLQRSMLVSFEGMTEIEIRIMNAATGSAVCIIVFLLGLNLVQHKTPVKKKRQR